MSATALILAAGEGTRMKSSLPKVAHKVLGSAMLSHVVASARAAGIERILVVTGHGAEAVEALLNHEPVECVRQPERLGTGDAVRCALDAAGPVAGPVLVLSGDTPLIRPETIRMLIEAQAASGAACVMLSAVQPDPHGYGRIVRGADGSVRAIVEQRDLPPDLLGIAECNAGTYCFDGEALSAYLGRIETANAQGEYYLTDLVGLFAGAGLRVDAIVADDAEESQGVNTRVQLAAVTAAMQRRINVRHMLAGVTMTSPDLVWIGPNVTLGRDVILEPMTFLYGDIRVGDGSVIGPDTRITDSVVGRECVVDSSIVVGSTLADRVSVGPRAYLRPGTVMDDDSKAGTSVEIKKSHIGIGSKVPHLSYIGDATLGVGVNIGAGTITCNYDGKKKNPTVIGDRVFIGSDTMLVAPVTIGDDAVTAAGSVIAQDVPAGALAIERCEQQSIEGWAEFLRGE